MGIQRDVGKNYSYRSDVEHYEHGAVADRSDGRKFKKTQEVPNMVYVDEASTSVTYVGETKPGIATSEPYWRIIKITESGNLTTVQFADGEDSFTQIWDDRASLSYS